MGKRHLERALEAFEGRAQLSSVTWRPYLLNPQIPEEGIALREFLKIKFNTQDMDEIRAKTASSPLNSKAEAMGITFNKERKMINTIRSHCLTELAHTQGKGDALAEELFTAYFVRGEDCNDLNVLCRIADKVGVNGTRQCLESDVYRHNVWNDWVAAQKSGVTSVPHFTIRVGHTEPARFSGAQSLEHFTYVLENLLQMAEVPLGSRVRINGVEGDVCSFHGDRRCFGVKPLDAGTQGEGLVWAQRDQLQVLWHILPGSLVQLDGLKAAELNGLQGEVVAFHPEKCRFEVRLQGGGDAASKALRGDNLTVVQALSPGDRVELCGLSAGHLNGQQGEVLSYQAEKCRFEVRLQGQGGSGQVKAIRLENLRPAARRPSSPREQDDHSQS